MNFPVGSDNILYSGYLIGECLNNHESYETRLINILEARAGSLLEHKAGRIDLHFEMWSNLL